MIRLFDQNTSCYATKVSELTQAEGKLSVLSNPCSENFKNALVLLVITCVLNSQYTIDSKVLYKNF